MNTILMLVLSVAILTIAIVQYKAVKTTNEKLADLYDRIEIEEHRAKRLENQVCDSLYMNECGSYDFDRKTLKTIALRAERTSELVANKLDDLERYLGIEYKTTPATPAKTRYVQAKQGKKEKE